MKPMLTPDAAVNGRSASTIAVDRIIPCRGRPSMKSPGSTHQRRSRSVGDADEGSHCGTPLHQHDLVRPHELVADEDELVVLDGGSPPIPSLEPLATSSTFG